MSDYWIADAEGRVLGPVGLEVLKDLIRSGRLQSITGVSRDGRSWAPLASVPELTAVATKDAERTGREKREAARLRAQLETLRIRPAHDVFKVAPDAPLSEYRDAFFRISKRFHPDALPKDVDPELAEACAAAFQFLSGLMNRVETALQPSQPARGARSPAAARELPRYDRNQFFGVSPLGDWGYEARIRISVANVGIFTDHPLMNLRQGCCFIAEKNVLPLGTNLALTFDFDDPPRTVAARGRVAWEAMGTGSAHGFGVSFMDLRAADRDFIKAYIERTQRKRASGAP